MELERTTFDLILYNSTLPSLNGVAFVSHLQKNSITTPVLMMVSNDVEVSMIVRYIKSGAEDVLQRPVNITQLLLVIRRLLKRGRGTKSVPKNFRNKKSTIPEITGNTLKILDIKATIQKLSKSDARVLITGANGTGKELVAH